MAFVTVSAAVARELGEALIRAADVAAGSAKRSGIDVRKSLLQGKEPNPPEGA